MATEPTVILGVARRWDGDHAGRAIARSSDPRAGDSAISPRPTAADRRR
ncbi:hypothetical protein [Salinispora pacifica]|nr:hypothetical protein [Salinispora pacifica]